MCKIQIYFDLLNICLHVVLHFLFSKFQISMSHICSQYLKTKYKLIGTDYIKIRNCLSDVYASKRTTSQRDTNKIDLSTGLSIEITEFFALWLQLLAQTIHILLQLQSLARWVGLLQNIGEAKLLTLLGLLHSSKAPQVILHFYFSQ